MTTARDVLDRAMTERDLSDWLSDLCRVHGALAYHTHDSRHSAAGYPDWTVVTRDARIAFVEIKTERGRLQVDQMDWIVALARVADRSHGRVRCFLVRPSTREEFERWIS